MWLYFYHLARLHTVRVWFCLSNGLCDAKNLTALVWKILCEHANLLQCPQSFKTHLSNCWLCRLLFTIWDPSLKGDSVVTSYPWLFWPADFLQTFGHLLTRVWKCSNSWGSHSLMFYPLFKCRLFYSVGNTKCLFFFLSVAVLCKGQHFSRLLSLEEVCFLSLMATGCHHTATGLQFSVITSWDNRKWPGEIYT